VKILGTRTPGNVIDEAEANKKRVARYLVPVTCRVVKLTLYCDGLGSGFGDQAFRGVVYSEVGSLVALGDEVLIHHGQAPGWVDLPFAAYPEGVLLAVGKFDLGFLAGNNDRSARVYGRVAAGV
jgi:hypothetical protein